jgi:hypothetical protein
MDRHDFGNLPVSEVGSSSLSINQLPSSRARGQMPVRGSDQAMRLAASTGVAEIFNQCPVPDLCEVARNGAIKDTPGVSTNTPLDNVPTQE